VIALPYRVVRNTKISGGNDMAKKLSGKKLEKKAPLKASPIPGKA
jgi:hypothetical protein